MNTAKPMIGDLIRPNPETFVGTISSISPEGHVTAIFYVDTTANLRPNSSGPDTIWKSK